MVLANLGRRLNEALAGLSKSNDVDQELLNSIVKEICAALLESDVNIKLVSQLRDHLINGTDLKQVQSVANKRRLVQKAIFDELCALVNPGNEPSKPKNGQPYVIMMVGLQGSGKTTTCTKLALYYIQRGFKAGLVCADTFRAGAFDQLKQNATKAGIPFYGSYTESDPVKISSQGVEIFKKDKFNIIIVDTSGRHRQEVELFQEMKEISEAIKPNQTIMVLDASIGQAAESQASAFKETSDFGAVIITKMDGDSKAGGALSAVASTKTPIIFIGTGEHAQDLERFSPQSYISKLLGLGDLRGFLDHVKAMNMDQNKSVMNNISKGVFTVRDMREQITNMMKLGPIGKMASMIPGMSQLMGEKGEEESTIRLKRMLYIVDSMTEEELNSDGTLFREQPTRITRVARGSGTSVREVEETLSQVRVFANMAKKLGGNQGLLKKLGNQGKGGMPQINQQSIAQMQKRLQSMGGMPNIPGLGGFDMKEMLKMAGNMDMNSLMSQFGGMLGGGTAALPVQQQQQQQGGGQRRSRQKK